MKRRDLIKTGICLGCAGALGSAIPVMKKNGISTLSDIELFLKERKFLYKNEKDLPKTVRLDICNLCQLNCPACTIRLNEDIIKKSYCGFGYVNYQTFKDFVDKHSFINTIELSYQGEMFLNPDLKKILKYAYKKGITLTAYNGVNLNTLSDEIAEALVKYKFGGMTVSIDGATPETYAIYRRGGDFNKVINNIKKIQYYQKKYKSKDPYMQYKFIVFGHNEHEIEAAKFLAAKLNMDITFTVNCLPSYSPVKNVEKVLASTNIKSLDSSVANFVEDYKSNPNNWFMCKDIFVEPQICWNGDLPLCPMPVQSFGINVFDVGLLKALNNKKVLQAKLMLSDFSVEPKYDIPCNKCELYLYLKSINYPFKYI